MIAYDPVQHLPLRDVHHYCVEFEQIHPDGDELPGMFFWYWVVLRSSGHTIEASLQILEGIPWESERSEWLESLRGLRRA